MKQGNEMKNKMEVQVILVSDRLSPSQKILSILYVRYNENSNIPRILRKSVQKIRSICIATCDLQVNKVYVNEEE